MQKTRALITGEHGLIGDIISDSFSDDPVNLWIFGGKAGIKHFYSAAAKKLYLPRGHGHVYEGGAGGCMWLPPGENKQIPIHRSLDIAAALIADNGLKSVWRGLMVDNYLAKAKPKIPHYYLFVIGARQAHQGKGIGSELMKVGLERVDAAGMPAYLESSKEANVPFYQRYGFEVLKRIIPARGCPPIWLMWREPRPNNELGTPE